MTVDDIIEQINLEDMKIELNGQGIYSLEVSQLRS